MRLLYYIFDINNQGFLRRLPRIIEAGIDLSVIGYKRDAHGVKKGEALEKLMTKVEYIDLGIQTKGVNLSRFRQILFGIVYSALCILRKNKYDVVMVRNLDMAVVALPLLARGRYDRFIYELLDIHPLTTGTGLVHRAARAAERYFLRRADTIVVSSPGIYSGYIAPLGIDQSKVRLIENKISPEHLPRIRRREASFGGRIRIGLFGKLRCQESLNILYQLAKQRPGEFEVVLCGYPDAVDPSLLDKMQRLENISFTGPYNNVGDLSVLINTCHFIWAIDLSNELGNSRWLLPNRLYESVACGVPVIARRGDETASIVEDRAWGLVISDMTPASVRDAIIALGSDRYRTLRETVRGARESDYVDQGEIETVLSRRS